MSRYSGAQGKGAARRTRELKQDEAEARRSPEAKAAEVAPDKPAETPAR
jgi:hypothetical protein